jgi:prepilin-type N-terminal cleavage/methylation domain-containing protein
MVAKRNRARLTQGFSLLEVLVVIAIIGIVAGIAIVSFSNVLPRMRADGALQLLVAQMLQARETSVDQRRNVTVTFQGTGEIVTVLQNLNATTTQLSDYVLPYGMIFTVFAGVPDTPDGFVGGPPVNAVNCDCAGGLPCTITFQSDGTVLDSTGNYVNATVFIGNPGQTSGTARAMTILGTTGRIKGYHYSGSAWF